MAPAVPVAGGAPARARTLDEIVELLAGYPCFARFDRPSLLAIAAQCGFATYEAGTTIMREGDAADFALVILRGEVEVFVDLPTGRVPMARLGRNRLIGELGVFTDMPRTATVVACTSILAVRIDQAHLMQLSAELPSVGVTIIRELGGRLARMNRWLAYLTYAAEALGRDEYDAGLLDELLDQPGELAVFAEAFAGMAAELHAKQNRRAEMQAAAQIQQSILPPPLVRDGALARIDLHAEMHPAREVGGDFYDYFPIDENRLAVTIADVSGKGIPASLFMAVARTVMRSMTNSRHMAAGLAHANRLLAVQNPACMFVTAFHGVLDLASGRLRYCNAGHNPPYLLRADGGCESLRGTAIPLGIDAGRSYRSAAVDLRCGDTLFLFSDGITEAFDSADEEFGTARLIATLERYRGAAVTELVGGVLAAVREFAGGAEQSDDITCLALAFRP